MTEPLWRRLLWPSLRTSGDCRFSARAASIAACLNGALTVVFWYVGAKGLVWRNTMGAEGALAIVLGYGISRMSKLCAILVLLLYLAERFALASNITSLFIAALLISGVRACWRFHELRL